MGRPEQHDHDRGEEEVSPPSRLPRQLLLAGFLLMLGTLCQTELAFGFVGSGLSGLVILGPMLIFFVMLIVRLRLQQWRAARGYCFFMAALITAFLVASSLQSRQAKAAKEAASPILSGLQKYARDTGSFPHQLSELVPRYLGTIDEAPVGLLRRLPYRYHLSEDGASWVLSFPTPAFMTWSFRSSEGQWVLYD